MIPLATLLSSLLLILTFLTPGPAHAESKDWAAIREIDHGFIVDHPYWRDSGGQVFLRTPSTRVSDWNIVCEKIGDRFKEAYSYKKLGGRCDGFKTEFQLVAASPEYEERPERRDTETEYPACGRPSSKTSNGFILVKLTCKLEKIKKRFAPQGSSIGFKNFI